jgi:uncharacterized protein
MIGIGFRNLLSASHQTPQGWYLCDDEETEILLPNKEVPLTLTPGDQLEVFCYLDHDERPIVSLKMPLIERDKVAVLKMAETSDYGYFLDWGLEKQLFLPFKESSVKHTEGDEVLVVCILDPLSGRLMASERIEKHHKPASDTIDDSVAHNAYVYRETPLGYEVFTESGYKGLLFRNRIAASLNKNHRLIVFVEQLRPDGKIDFALQPKGEDKLSRAMSILVSALEASNGFLPLNDQSPSPVVFEHLNMSKKTFKAALGMLLKHGKVTFEGNGVRIVVN